jgi:hypothetical protein
LPVGLVDSVKQRSETWRLVHGPKPLKRSTKEIHVLLGQQSYRNDPSIGHGKPPVNSG